MLDFPSLVSEKKTAWQHRTYLHSALFSVLTIHQTKSTTESYASKFCPIKQKSWHFASHRSGQYSGKQCLWEYGNSQPALSVCIKRNTIIPPHLFPPTCLFPSIPSFTKAIMFLIQSRGTVSLSPTAKAFSNQSLSQGLSNMVHFGLRKLVNLKICFYRPACSLACSQLGRHNCGLALPQDS